MEIKVFAKTRDGIAKAEALYKGDQIIVQKGSRVKTTLAKSVRGGNFVRQYLDDHSFVSQEGEVLKECLFNSPSIAAMFVTGNTSNGYRVWKTVDGKTLGDFLKENNLR